MRLSPRADGRFGKVIDGVYRYFGSNGDRDQALRELADFIRLRGRGVTAPDFARVAGNATVRMVSDAFLDHCDSRFVGGALTKGSRDDYAAAVKEFVNLARAASTLADDLVPDDFARVRRAWSTRLGPWALDRNVQAVRTMFNWALRHRMIERQPFYGDAFHKSTAGQKRRVQHGDRRFFPGELWQILQGDDRRDPLDGQLRAFVLLGLNGGMYSKDIADLCRQDLKREGGVSVIDTWREKTGIRRRCPLWPETVEAIEAVPAPARGDRLFLTCFGNPWNRRSTDAIAQEFDKWLGVLELPRRAGVGFGSLRHTHVSAVGDHPDLVAARLVRAHKIGSIESHYDFPTVDRLLAVTALARRRLLPWSLEASSRTPAKNQHAPPTATAPAARQRTRAHA